MTNINNELGVASLGKKHRILVMSHAHPDFSLGGGGNCCI